MATLKYFIRTSKSGSKEASIRLRLSNGRQFNTSAPIKKQISVNFWNNDKGAVRRLAEFTDAEEVQKELDNLRDHIKKAFEAEPKKGNLTNDWLITAIDKYYNPEKYLQDNTTLFGFIQNFIATSHTRVNLKTGNPVCYKMRREYQVTFDYLQAYANEYGKPDFLDIDLEFYQQFVDFLRKNRLPTSKGKKPQTGLSVNTIGKKIQTLKIFLNAAAEHGINPSQKYKSRNFVTISEESDNIYLTKEELSKLYNFDLSDKPSLDRVRDKFIVASWTGLRYSDLQQITPDKVKGDYIELKQQKTGKKVVIPIHYTVTEILNKYNGKLPKPISNQKYNELLKEAARLAGIDAPFIKTASYNGLKVEKKYPKYELISSHTARRSFCTNAYKDNIPTLAIMAISGHRTEQAFLKYIKADGKEHAEKVLQAWRKNGEFIRVAK